MAERKTAKHWGRAGTARPSHQDIVRVLLEDSGLTYAREVGARVESNTPAPLFQTLVVALLVSARISTSIAMKAARALFDEGWTTPRKMAASTWDRRVQVLNRSGYARYDNSTATELGKSVDLLLERWKGDLRNLREEAGRDPEREQELLTEFTGIGPLGAAIFCREVQGVWDELYPFADQRVREEAARLGLPKSARGLAELTTKQDFPRLVAAIMRVALADRQAEIRERARQ